MTGAHTASRSTSKRANIGRCPRGLPRHSNRAEATSDLKARGNRLSGHNDQITSNLCRIQLDRALRRQIGIISCLRRRRRRTTGRDNGLVIAIARPPSFVRRPRNRATLKALSHTRRSDHRLVLRLRHEEVQRHTTRKLAQCIRSRRRVTARVAAFAMVASVLVEAMKV